MTQDQINIDILKIMQDDIKQLEKTVANLSSDRKSHRNDLDRLTLDINAAYTRASGIERRLGVYDRAINSVKDFTRRLVTGAVVLLAIFGLAMLLANNCKAAELTNIANDKWSNFRLFEADKLDMEYRKVAVHRDFFYEEDQTSFNYGAAVLFDLRVARYFYWKNNVHMLATDAQVRAVGWEFEQGLNASKYLDVFYYHHSQHILERERPTRGYPLTNEYGVRFHFIHKDRK